MFHLIFSLQISAYLANLVFDLILGESSFFKIFNRFQIPCFPTYRPLQAGVYKIVGQPGRLPRIKAWSSCHNQKEAIKDFYVALIDVLMDVLCLESRSILAPVGLGLLLVLLLSLTGQLTFTLLFSSHLKVVADTSFS